MVLDVRDVNSERWQGERPGAASVGMAPQGQRRGQAPWKPHSTCLSFPHLRELAVVLTRVILLGACRWQSGPVPLMSVRSRYWKLIGGGAEPCAQQLTAAPPLLGHRGRESGSRHGQGQQAAQDLLWSGVGVERLQGRRLRSLPGQLAPVFDCPHGGKPLASPDGWSFLRFSGWLFPPILSLDTRSCATLGERRAVALRQG